MHDRETIAAALSLSLEDGLSSRNIGLRLGVHHSSVNAWLAGRLPRSFASDLCPSCGARHTLDRLDGAYAYLLGLYLGDGHLAEHPRHVFRLRITLDSRYPGIVASAQDAMERVRGRDAHRVQRSDGCLEVSSYWRSWPCLLPQHGPGKKHDRAIVLLDWQETLVEAHPQGLIRGLIHSDGCRFQSTGRGGWSAPRYSFTNRSSDIHGIFQRACESIGVRWTATTSEKRTITYVSRQADVATLDAFIGPKR